jgi:hypothetical protein
MGLPHVGLLMALAEGLPSRSVLIISSAMAPENSLDVVGTPSAECYVKVFSP